ncbi:hypothetical protein [Actinoplanes sp. DH11]|uniref:hypothetical protein n=1 Tax=Actinoplanes sp. DH11 TaxID=2857011 RepID=UPI001E4A7302|nr:hypothetical protein [Actinoplanes sp. DH11]
MAVATVGFCAGGILVGGAGIVLLLILGDLRALRALRRTPVTDGTARGRVAVEGTIGYGPAGPQRAPVSDAECAWYRATLTRSPGRGGTGDDVLLEITSPAWPILDGRLPIDPRLLDQPRTLTDPDQHEPRASTTVRIEYRRAAPVRLPRVVPPDVVDDLRDDELLWLTEVRVPHGRRVFALGRRTGDGLRPGRSGLSLLTTLTRAEVITARQDAIGTGWRLMLLSGSAGLLLAAGCAAWLAALG